MSSKSLAFFQESFISFQVIVSKEAKFESTAEAGHITSQLQAQSAPFCASNSKYVALVGRLPVEARIHI